MTWQPNKWIALILSLFNPLFGFLYTGHLWWGILFFLVALFVGVLDFFHIYGPFPLLTYPAVLWILLIAGVVQSYRFAMSAQAQEMRPWYTRWYGLFAVFAVFVLGVVGMRTFLYEPFRVPSHSMSPALEPGMKLIVQKWGYGHFSLFGKRLASSAISAELKRGDIIVFDFPADPTLTYVQRLVGLPSDKISYRDNHLFINGADTRIRQLDDYLDNTFLLNLQRFLEKAGDTEYEILLRPGGAQYREADSFPFKDKCSFDAQEIRCEVPPGHYFVLADNRDNSTDSRMWGFVPADHIVGKVANIIR
ncbi:signal peptidase I [Collimonas silvisoli]|uniref:signal peptidase I n=1 Tax=Collimonas silvisoli TaxID=2825884 RepID=UPI001B8AD003|nr:signal peptidase I [Collimonas silvisoli]